MDKHVFFLYLGHYSVGIKVAHIQWSTNNVYPSSLSKPQKQPVDMQHWCYIMYLQLMKLFETVFYFIDILNNLCS